jgi:hypothetical protein
MEVLRKHIIGRQLHAVLTFYNGQMGCTSTAQFPNQAECTYFSIPSPRYSILKETRIQLKYRQQVEKAASMFICTQ